MISARRAERDLDETRDTVRADVRRAIRRIEQQENLMQIQAINVEELEFRLAASKAQYELGQTDNQEVVDTENDLLDARNDFASAVAGYRNAILQFRLETGTLRVNDEGLWDRSQTPWMPAVEIAEPQTPP